MLSAGKGFFFNDALYLILFCFLIWKVTCNKIVQETTFHYSYPQLFLAELDSQK